MPRIDPNVPRSVVTPRTDEKSPSAPAPAVVAPPAAGPSWAAVGQVRNVAPPSPLVTNAASRAMQAGASAISYLSKTDLAGATTDQKIAMTRTLLNGIRQTQPHEEDGRRLREAVGQVAASVQSPTEFDRLFYSVDGNALLDNSGGLSRALKARLDTNLQKTQPGDWDGFNQYLDQVTGTRSAKANSVEFLVDGEATTAAFKKDLAAATKSVDISVFQWQPDQEVGWPLAKALADKAKAGVQVRVLLDEHGSMPGEDKLEAKKMVAHMKAAGVDVIVNPASLLSSHLDHRKVAVFDDKVAYTGGMNIGRHYQVEWHDQQTRVEGPSVENLHDAFRQRWQKEGGKATELDLLPPASAPVENGIETRVVAHGGDHQDAYLKATYLKAIATAQTSIRIANPYFTDQDVAKALGDAAKRGVQVQVVLPKENDMGIVQRASRALYPEMIAAGVEVYEYAGRMAHQKVATMDGKFSTFGSSNLDARSLHYNDEMNMVSLEPKLAKSINEKMFEVDIAKSQRITSYEPSLREKIDKRLGGLL